MNTKAIAILGAIFLLIVGTLGFLIYSKYHTKTQTAVEAQQTNQSQHTNTTTSDTTVSPTPVSPAPTQNNSPFVRLTQDQVVSPALFYDGKGITYFDKQGQIYQAALFDNQGSVQLDKIKNLEIKTKSGISKILWPKKGDDFIAEFNQGDKKTWSYFNSKTGDYIDYPPQVVSVDWMSTGDKILYVWLENGKTTLNISDPDTKNWKQISEMWETDNEVHISPDGLNIAYYETGSASSTNAINLTTPDGKVWKSLVKSGYNFGVLWSPDSQKFLFQQRDPSTQKNQLWYYDVLSGDAKNLQLFTTLDKVVWARDAKTIYVAAPISGSAGGSALTTDAFIKLDINTFAKQEYKSDQGLVIDGRDLFLGLGEKQLFFRNAQDGSLYYLDLTK